MNTADQSPTHAGPIHRSLGDMLASQVRQRGHHPLLTYYDESSGERTELSYATLFNWSSKSANLLTEELGLARSAVVAIHGVDHWTGLAIAVGAWQVGAAVTARGGDGDVLVVSEADAAGRDHPALLVVGGGMGGRVAGEVAGIPYGDEVLSFADDYDDLAVSLDDVALETVTQGELLREGFGVLVAQDRVLVTGGLHAAARALVAAASGGASVVWCVGMASDRVAASAEAERVTHVLDDDGSIAAYG